MYDSCMLGGGQLSLSESHSYSIHAQESQMSPAHGWINEQFNTNSTNSTTQLENEFIFKAFRDIMPLFW